MSIDEFTELISIPQRKPLPKSAKSNLTKLGNKIPMSKFIALSLYSTPISPKSFQRISGTYYRTSLLGDCVTLFNEVTQTFIRVDFRKDTLLYMTIYVSRNETRFSFPKPTTNRDLFIKITSKNLF